jgi:hypothetical protein
MIFDEFQSAGPGVSGTIIIQMCNTLHIWVFYVSGI